MNMKQIAFCSVVFMNKQPYFSLCVHRIKCFGKDLSLQKNNLKDCIEKNSDQ